MLAGMVAACASRSESPADNADSADGQASRAVSPNSDPTSALVAFLEASREGAPKSATPFDSLVTCQIGDGMYQPIQLLATYHPMGTEGAGDTVSIGARVTTVAEEDGSPTHPDRFVAIQRIKTETQRWRVARTPAGGWRVCSGPQFGPYGSDRTTTWQPAGASYTSARRLADSVYQADPPSRGGGQRTEK
jgi:hypothetical protein